MAFQTREHFSKLLLDRNKWAVSSRGSTIHVVRTAEPVGLRAAASGAGSLIRTTLLLNGHLNELVAGSNNWTVSSGGSAVHVVRAAEPVGLRAAASRAGSLIRTALPEKMSFLLDLMDCTLDIFTFYIQGLTFNVVGQIYNRNCY